MCKSSLLERRERPKQERYRSHRETFAVSDFKYGFGSCTTEEFLVEIIEGGWKG